MLPPLMSNILEWKYKNRTNNWVTSGKIGHRCRVGCHVAMDTTRPKKIFLFNFILNFQFITVRIKMIKYSSPRDSKSVQTSNKYSSLSKMHTELSTKKKLK